MSHHHHHGFTGMSIGIPEFKLSFHDGKLTTVELLQLVFSSCLREGWWHENTIWWEHRQLQPPESEWRHLLSLCEVLLWRQIFWVPPNMLYFYFYNLSFGPRSETTGTTVSVIDDPNSRYSAVEMLEPWLRHVIDIITKGHPFSFGLLVCFLTVEGEYSETC